MWLAVSSGTMLYQHHELPLQDLSTDSMCNCYQIYLCRWLSGKLGTTKPCRAIKHTEQLFKFMPPEVCDRDEIHLICIVQDLGSVVQ